MGKSLIVYYSMDGNTRQIAERIQAETGFPLIQLETAEPYTGTDAEIVAQGQEEVNRGYQPPLKPLGVDLEAYDTFLVGTPTWWIGGERRWSRSRPMQAGPDTAWRTWRVSAGARRCGIPRRSTSAPSSLESW